MKIKLIDKYLFKSVTQATLVCIFLFMIVWIAPETLFNTIRDYMKDYFPLDVAIKIIISKLPEILGRALPVGLLLGTLFTFDKFSKDSELTVMRAFGLSFWQIVKAPIFLSLFLTYLCFVVHDLWMPWATNTLINIQKDVREGYFVHTIKDQSGDLKKIIIVSKFDTRNYIDDVTILDFNKEGEDDISALSRITVADSAIDNSNNWTLYGVKQYNISTSGVFNEIKDIETSNLYNKEEASRIHKLMLYSVKKQKEMTNDNIKEYLSLLKAEGYMDDYNYFLNKLIQRYSHSFMCILFTILGCLLGFSNVREQRLVGFTVAIGIIFIYFITLPFFDMMAEKSILSPYITSTIQPIIAIFIIFFIKKVKDI